MKHAAKKLYIGRGSVPNSYVQIEPLPLSTLGNRLGKYAGYEFTRVEIGESLGTLTSGQFLDIMSQIVTYVRNGGKLKMLLADPDAMMRRFAQRELPLAQVNRSLFDPRKTLVSSPMSELVTRMQDIGFSLDRIGLEGEVTFQKRMKGQGEIRRVIIGTPDCRKFVSCGVVATRVAIALMNEGVDVVVESYLAEVEQLLQEDYDHRVYPVVKSHVEVKDDDLYIQIDGPWCALARQNFVKHRWGYFYHELHAIPNELIEPIQLHCEKLFFVSDFCRRNFQLTGLDKEAGVIHHGYDPTVFYPRKEKTRWPNDFVFLSVATQQRRKGTYELIEAFKSTFGEDERVKLVIKDIRNPWLKYNELCDHPNIILIQDALEDHEIAELMRQSDCFTLPTYGEGFGIPVLEAKACNIPVIVTGWGGQMDFCRPNDTYLIGYDMEVRRDNYEYEFQRPQSNFTTEWARPRVGELSQLMRHVFENREEAQGRADLAYDYIKDMTWDNVLSPLVEEVRSVYT